MMEVASAASRMLPLNASATVTTESDWNDKLTPMPHCMSISPSCTLRIDDDSAISVTSMDSVRNDDDYDPPPLLTIDVPDEGSASDTATSPPDLTRAYPFLDPSPSGSEPKEKEYKTSPKEEVPIQTTKKRSRYYSPTTSSQAKEPSRVTRNREGPEEVVNNYVDSNELKEPRRVNPPVGAYRTPFKLPKLDIEKEKDKLRINMVGPKTRTQPEEEAAHKHRRRQMEIGVGHEYQAEITPLIGKITTEERLNYTEDKEEMIWKDDSRTEKVAKELDAVWMAIRRQFNGKIGIDAMLRRLMNSDYDIDDMLRKIELEQYEFVNQPFEPLNIAQQREFERLLRKPGHANGKHREGEKIFRQFQERFMKTYYMGEIVQYYYDTKRTGCWHQLYGRCECRENLIDELAPVERYECVNCTRYIWKDTKRSPEKRCAICTIYLERNKKDRLPEAPLFEADEKIAKFWVNLENTTGLAYSVEDVLDKMEQERRETLFTKPTTDELPPQFVKGKAAKLSLDQVRNETAKFKVVSNNRCSMVNPWGRIVLTSYSNDYSPAEKISIVKAFRKHGVNFNKVAQEVNKSEIEISCFFQSFRIRYQLEPKPRKSRDTMESIHQAPQSVERSLSPTPEPPKRKRYRFHSKTCEADMMRVPEIRGASIDPEYKEPRLAHAPPAKTSRKTRQAARVTL